MKNDPRNSFDINRLAEDDPEGMIDHLIALESEAKGKFADFQQALARGADLRSPSTIWQAIDLLTKRAEYHEAAILNLTARLGQAVERLVKERTAEVAEVTIDGING